MEIVVVQPKLVKSDTLPLKEVRILPVGDVQFGSQGTDIDRLEKYIKWGLQEEAYFVGMGDMVDTVSPSNRALLSSLMPNLYDSTSLTINKAFGRLAEEVSDILEKTKGRWLGFVRGHHYWVHPGGYTTDYMLARVLEAPYLGDCGIISLEMTEPRTQQKIYGQIWVHHGQGSGITEGAALNKLGHVTKTFFANIYMMGHFHRKSATAIPWIEYIYKDGQPVENAINRYLVSTGGFLKGYQLGSLDESGYPAGGYIEKKMLTPVALGGTLVQMRPALRLDGRIRVDINVSV